MIGKRTPIKWPDGARIAITPCVAYETWPEDLGTADSVQNQHRRRLTKGAPTKRDLAVIMDRDYGDRVGVFRMLDIFRREKIHTTFFASGMNAERFPEVCRAIHDEGHEVASENYIHDYNYLKGPAEEHADLKKTVQAIKEVVGEPPLGYLSTGVFPSENTPVLAAEEGYVYWMDPQHEETPYTLKVGDKKLVVLSYYLYLNDYSTLKVDERTPRELLQIWKDTFDLLYREGEENPKFMIWGLHPFLSGRPYRAKVLEEFIQHAKSHPKVWFARGIDIARWWQENYADTHVEEWPNYTIAGRRAKKGEM